MPALSNYLTGLHLGKSKLRSSEVPKVQSKFRNFNRSFRCSTEARVNSIEVRSTARDVSLFNDSSANFTYY